MDLSGDDHLERAVTELGEPEALFRISSGRFLAKLSLGVFLLVLGGVANYLWWVAGPARLEHWLLFVLFGLPPGRIGERDPLIEGAPKPERALPASIAKRRLIEAMRDVALEDVELAKAITPVLGEFAASTAKGEWQASVQALTALRARHAELAP